MRINEEKKETIKKMTGDRRFSRTDIAKEILMNKSSVYRWQRKMGLI